MLRQALVTAYTWTYERFFAEGMCWPWRAALLVDGRVAISESSSAVRQTEHSLRTLLRRRVTAAEDLFRYDIQDALRQWTWSVRCGISDTECVHGRNHRRAHAGQDWRAFAAAHIDAEARTAHEEAIDSGKKGIDGKGMISKSGWEMKKSNVCTVSLCSARSCVNVQRD